MHKQQSLTEIAEEITRCKVCKEGKSGLPVPGEGNPKADIVFMGEAPGRTEARTGRPFVGRSGRLLRSLINNAGLREDEVFITSPVKYFPDRGTPTKADIAHGMIHTKKQLDIINPKLIVLLGSTAVQGILGEKLPITKVHGDVVEKIGKTYVIMFHPSAGLRFPQIKEKLKADFQNLKDTIALLLLL